MNYKAVNMLITIFAFSMLIAGCSGSNNMEKEFLTKLNGDDQKALCFDISSILDLELVGEEHGDQYFINSNGLGFAKTEEGKKMLSKLVEKGFVDAKPTKLRYQFAQRDAYKLTEKGRKYFVWGKTTCLGERIATNIVEYTEPSEMMGMTVTEVKFAYDMKINDLAVDLGMEEKLVDGEDVALFVKTNKGWRLDGS